jgi:uncharacterized protein YbaR (Trm112 family)/SAM-dependent methyltransferase
MTELAELLACPRCAEALEAMSCPACRTTYPVHGDIPWLFADPAAAISDWKQRWRLAALHLEADLQRVQHDLAAKPGRATRRRLETLAAGYRNQLRCLPRILEPLALAEGGSMETLLALRTRLPLSHGIFSYEANVHRDWCWGEPECRQALDVLLEVLDGFQPATVLVLGAGAGRLAYDLHQATAAALTVALELNPLLAYAGATVSAGAELELVEFPLAPRSPEAAALTRRLRAPAPSGPGLVWLLADAARPPFRPQTFDLVVTPWLLDVMDAPTADTLARVNHLLRADGIWIHHGSAAFDGPEPSARWTATELIEAAAARGFDDLRALERETPYMCCPASRHGRIELVTTLRGRKARAAPQPRHHESLPDWIITGRSPVPDLPEFRMQAMTTRLHAFLMTLIDGRRSLKEMAGVLEQQQLMLRGEAEAALRGFLTKMYDEAKRAGRPPI